MTLQQLEFLTVLAVLLLLFSAMLPPAVTMALAGLLLFVAMIAALIQGHRQGRS